jgi:hypothetical protein
MEKQNLTQKEALDMLKQMSIPATAQNLAYYSQTKELNNVELLLIGGVNPNEIYVNQKNQKVYTFQNACIAGDIPTLEMLLAYGANIDLVDDDGRTALHTAINQGKTDIVKFLIENGADVNALTKNKQNALHMAQEKNNNELVEILRNAGAREMTESEKKEFKQDKTIKRASMVVMLGLCFGLTYWCTNHKSSSSGGSSSGSSVASHTCLNCGKSYSGYGYATIGGEEYALSKDQGNQYCSSSCAKASRTGRFKNM